MKNVIEKKPEKTIDRYADMQARLDKAIDALQKIANYDYRGNRSGESEFAFKVLKELE